MKTLKLKELDEDINYIIRHISINNNTTEDEITRFLNEENLI